MPVLEIAEERNFFVEPVFRFREEVEFTLLPYISIPFVIFGDVLIEFYPGQFAVVVAVVETVHPAERPVERIFGV